MSRRGPRLPAWARVVAGVLALGACLLLGWTTPRVALLCYLVAWLFWLAPVLGSVGLLCIHALTGGDWGRALRPPLLAMSRRLPRMAVLVLPLLLGAGVLFPWMHPPAHDPELARQRWYLNPVFLVLRTAIAFALWTWLAAGLRGRLADAARPVAGFAAGTLVVHALLVTVIAADWVMSLVPRWHSSALGLTVLSAQLLAAAAAAVALSPAAGAAPAWPTQRLRDLGNLLLAALMGLGYLAFMDYLTAWIADLPSETVWYLPRLRTGWAWLGAGLAAAGLALPFLALLWRRAKQRPAVLAAIGGWLWLVQLGFTTWLVLPGQVAGPAWLWLLPLAVAGVGALWWPPSAGPAPVEAPR